MKIKQVIIDAREPDWFNQWFDERGYKVFRTRITEDTSAPTGDFIGNTKIMIERKTMTDFDNSFSQREGDSIWNQAERMVEWRASGEGRAVYIIIIGNTDFQSEHYEMNPNGRVGAIGSLMVRYQIPVTIVQTEHHAFLLMEKLFRSHSEGKLGQAREQSKFTKASTMTMVERILILIPGISRVRAKDIVAKYDLWSPNQLVEIPLKWIKNVDGIGSKTILNIDDHLRRYEKDILNFDWREFYGGDLK